MRAAGVPGRGENGKTCRWVSPQSSTIASEFSNIASLSVGKPAMRSAPNTTSGRSRRTVSVNADRIAARMAPLHALQDHVVARLQRQMEVRHEPLLLGDRADQRVVGLDRIDRGEAQPLELRHVAEDGADQLAEARPARQVGAVGGDVDAGQDDFAIAVRDELADLLDDRAHRHRARIAAAIGDDAEGAAVVAAVLHLDEGPGPAVHAFDEMQRRLAHRHDVVDADAGVVADEVGRVARGAAASPHCRGRGRPRACAAKLAGSICAAQPVTTIRASGRSRLRRAGSPASPAARPRR